MRNLLLFVLIIPSLVVVTPADNRPKPETKSQILSRLSDYKSWKQVNRLDDARSASFMIEVSTVAG